MAPVHPSRSPATAKDTASVVFPVPPFWATMAITSMRGHTFTGFKVYEFTHQLVNS